MDANEVLFTNMDLASESSAIQEPETQRRAGKGSSNKYIIHQKNTGLVNFFSEIPQRIALNQIRKALKKTDFIAAIIAVITIVIIRHTSDSFYYNDNESDIEITSLRCLNAILSVILACLIVKHHRLQYDMSIEMKSENANNTFRQSKKFWPWVFECCIMCVFTPPYFDFEFQGEMLDGTYVYSVDSIISCISFTRLLLVFKLYPHLNKWTRSMVNELSIQDQYKAMSNEFLFKFELRYSAWILLTVLVLILVAYAGYTFRVLERSYESEGKSSLNLEDIYNCLWISFTSLSTVGYGDGYPSTHLGRLVGAGTWIFGIFFTALVIGLALRFTELSEKDAKAYYMLKRKNRMKPVRVFAADVIKTAFRLKAAWINRPQMRMFITRYYDRIYTPKLKQFVNLYKFYRHSFIPAPLACSMMQQKMKLDSKYLRRGSENFQKTTSYKEKLERLAKNRDSQSLKLKKIIDELTTIEKEFLILVNNLAAPVESLT